MCRLCICMSWQLNDSSVPPAGGSGLCPHSGCAARGRECCPSAQRRLSENYPAWLDAIHNAQHWIHFETYILHDDKIGKVFAEALCERARAGVKVRLLVDWLGSLLKSGPGFWRRVRQAGVEARSFGYPTHRFAARLGLARSPQVARRRRPRRLRQRSLRRRRVERRSEVRPRRPARYRRDDRRPRRRGCRGGVCGSVGDHRRSHSRRANCRPPDRSLRAATCRCASCRRCRRPRGVFKLDQLVASVARETLWITDAYFVGVSAYMRALIAAAEDGVDVRMLVPGTVDVLGVGAMSRAGFRALLDGGVRIFEWNGVDGPRQDGGRRRQVGARRIDQPQHHELVRQLGARRRHRGRAVRPADDGRCTSATSRTRPRSC